MKKMKVLIITTILCVGIFFIVTKVNNQKQLETMINQISSLGLTVGKYNGNISQIMNEYNKNYAFYLYQSKDLPEGLSYDGNIISVANNATIKATVDNNNVVVFEISNLDTNSCVKIATINWGYLQTNKFAGIGIGQAPDFSCLEKGNCKFNYIASYSGTSDYPFTIDRAKVPCSMFEEVNQPASVFLGYKLQ